MGVKSAPRLLDLKHARERLASKHLRIAGYEPCFESPESHVERLLHRLLHCRDPRLPGLVDKIAVKHHVRSLLGDAWVTPTWWQGTTLPNPHLVEWNIPFVIKANNASNRNIFVLEKADFCWIGFERSISRWRETPYGRDTFEWFYAEIEPRILVEPYLGASFQHPLDFRIYVFSGKAQLIEVSVDRATIYKWTYYTTSWTRWKGAEEYRTTEREIPRPASLNKMLAAAEALAEDHPFVRVDLYDIDGRPRFSELTFFPGAGMDFFMSREDNLALGKLWPPLKNE